MTMRFHNLSALDAVIILAVTVFVVGLLMALGGVAGFGIPLP